MLLNHYPRLLISSIAGCLLFLCMTGCIAPVNTTDSDYIEYESIWQYLRAYCIYQDSSIYNGRIPDDPFSFRSPEALLKSVGDTLYGEHYTRYTFTEIPVGDEVVGTARVDYAAGTAAVVTLDTLTDSTVRIVISSFEYGITYSQFLDALRGIKSFPNVVIDLRGNGGGDIDDATQIVNAFIPAGTPYLMARERTFKEETHSAYTLGWHPWKTKDVARQELKDKNVAVLMDGGSASASEILIAALKDCANAPLVGTRSYGKGIGQIKIVRRGRSDLQITFLQMRGMSDRIGLYHHRGIEPDVAVTDRSQQLFEAVKVHEPSVKRLLTLDKRISAPPTPVAGYRTIYEE